MNIGNKEGLHSQSLLIFGKNYIKNQIDKDKIDNIDNLQTNETDIAICVSPESGFSAYNGEYDYHDLNQLISFINYYIVKGVRMFLIFNNMLKTIEIIHHISHLSKQLNISITLIPEINRREGQYNNYKDLIDNFDPFRHSAYIFPTLYNDMCLQYSYLHGISKIIMVSLLLLIILLLTYCYYPIVIIVFLAPI
jgi:hypothetical protein